MLIALAFLVAALFTFFDFIQPTYGHLQTKKGTELSSENFLSNEQQIVGQAKTLISQYENEGAVQDSLALAMPSGPNIASALAQVYGIALNNNVAIQSVGITSPMVELQNQAQQAGASAGLPAGQGTKQMGTFSLQIAAAGSYENFKSFLSQLEMNIRIFDLTALSIQPPQSGVLNGKGSAASSDLFTYNFTVATYYELP